jgi:hypothetical protein
MVGKNSLTSKGKRTGWKSRLLHHVTGREKLLTLKAWFLKQICSTPPPYPPTSTNLRLSTPIHNRSLVIWQDVQEVSNDQLIAIHDVSMRPRRPIELTSKFLPSGSGIISSFARAARPALSATPRRALRPSNLRYPINSRWASAAAGAGNGKIHQVSCPRRHHPRSLLPFPRPDLGFSVCAVLTTTKPAGHWCRRRWFVTSINKQTMDQCHCHRTRR